MSDFVFNRDAVLAELRRRQAAKENEVPKFDFAEHCFEKQVEFFKSPGARFRTAVCSRRAGKCRPAGTLVKTPTGSVPIEKLRVGDDVYGYTKSGKVEICKVKAVWHQGTKDVVDIIHNRRIVASSTLDHKWLAKNIKTHKEKVKPLKHFNSKEGIRRAYVKIPGGTKEVPEAYAIGALLGDGCSTSSGIVMSCGDEEVPVKCIEVLKGLELSHTADSYQWRIKGLKKNSKTLKFYNLWCRGRKAHEKTFDLQEVRSWSRKSQLELIAGLIDTDGCVDISGKSLRIRLGMQAKTVVENVSMLLLDLFQIQTTVEVDNRDIYVNGDFYSITIKGSESAVALLKELPTVVERKQWKPEYETLTGLRSHPDFRRFKLSKPYKAICYDITVDNDSNLFLDANGLVGHNTVGIAADMIDTCLSEPGSICLYLTLSKRNARNIIWHDIQKILSDYKIIHKPNQVEMSVLFENGSKINIEGAKDRAEVEKYRGWKLRKCYIDEAQSFRPYISQLVNEVITPALRDLRGELYLTGTPGPIPAGYFFECSHNDMWSNHVWTAFENPHMHDPEAGLDLEVTLTEERALKGVTELDPAYRRETYGEWVEDVDSLVYKYDTNINDFNVLPKAEYVYIMGVDIGYNDADAIAVLAYSHDHNKVYLVEEFVKPKQTISQLAEAIKEIDSAYGCVKKVIDAGALGKKIQEEIAQRYEIVLEAAEKQRKIEFIELMNADLRKGTLRAKSNSAFAEDCRLVQWDRDKSTPDRLKVSDTYHSDICDAVLYAYREARHYLYEKPAETLKFNTDAYMKELEEKEAKKVEEAKYGNDLIGLTDEECEDYERLMSDDDIFY